MSSTTGTYPGDDEDFITRILPQQLNKTSAAVSPALAVHFRCGEGRGGAVGMAARCGGWWAAACKRTETAEWASAEWAVAARMGCSSANGL